jgi:hypothetical protein
MMSIPRRIASVAIVLVTSATVCMANEQEKPEPIRDGSSFKKAIIVNVPQVLEVQWIMLQIRKLHPDANLGDLEQGLVSYKGRVYDVYDLRTKKGKRIVMYFDIGKDEDPSPTPTATVSN